MASHASPQTPTDAFNPQAPVSASEHVPRGKCAHPQPKNEKSMNSTDSPKKEDGTFILLRDGKAGIGKDLKLNPFCYNVQFNDSEEFAATEKCMDLWDWEIKEDESYNGCDTDWVDNPSRALFGWNVLKRGDLYNCKACGITLCTGCYNRAWGSKSEEFPHGFHLKRVCPKSFESNGGVVNEVIRPYGTTKGLSQGQKKDGFSINSEQKELYDSRISHAMSELDRSRWQRHGTVPSRSLSPPTQSRSPRDVVDGEDDHDSPGPEHLALSPSP